MVLVKYDAMRQQIAEVRRVDEVKDIRDKALALGLYAKQAKDDEMSRWWPRFATARSDAPAKMLRELSESGGRRGCGENQQSIPPTRGVMPRLSDLGVTTQQSSKWQKVSTIPEAKFEAILAKAEKPVTTRGRSPPASARTGADSGPRSPGRGSAWAVL